MIGHKTAVKVQDPVWQQVDIVTEATSSKGKPKVVYRHCHRQFWAGTPRIKEHFKGSSFNIKACKKVPASLHNELMGQQLRREAATTNKRTLDQLDKATSGLPPPPIRPLLAVGQLQIGFILQPQRKTDADAAVASFFYARGTPFNHVTEASFRKMCKLIGLYGPAYKPKSSTSSFKCVESLPGMPDERRERVLELFMKRWDQGH